MVHLQSKVTNATWISDMKILLPGGCGVIGSAVVSKHAIVNIDQLAHAAAIRATFVEHQLDG
jgi:hypothetical protein